MTGLNTCTGCLAMSARVTRLISSSLLPENIGPAMTSTQPLEKGWPSTRPCYRRVRAVSGRDRRRSPRAGSAAPCPRMGPDRAPRAAAGDSGPAERQQLVEPAVARLHAVGHTGPHGGVARPRAGVLDGRAHQRAAVLLRLELDDHQ